MLLHTRCEVFDDSCRVAFPVERRRALRLVTVLSMRIELPNASWANAAPRAEEDAHTLTVAGHSPSEWAPLDLLPAADRPRAMRTEVSGDDPLVLTITY